jgi:pyroglutamyl-peptidase
LTGFGPFPNMPANATALLVPLLAERAQKAFPSYRFEADVLATEWVGAPRALDGLLDNLTPVLAVHFGVSNRARGLVIETRAVNLRCGSIDACGASPGGGPLVAGGPDVRGVDLPAAHIVSRLRRRGIPSYASRDAGTYLCNALLWHSRQRAVTHDRSLRSGFVHIPSDLACPRTGRARPMPGCPLDWGQTLDGGLEIIAGALGYPSLAGGR